MALFGRGEERQSGRERAELRNHLRDLGVLRDQGLRELGDLAFEMQKSGRVDRDRLWEKASEVAAVEDEAELVHRGLKERLTLAQLEELAKAEPDGKGESTAAAGETPTG